MTAFFERDVFGVGFWPNSIFEMNTSLEKPYSKSRFVTEKSFENPLAVEVSPYSETTPQPRKTPSSFFRSLLRSRDHRHPQHLSSLHTSGGFCPEFPVEHLYQSLTKTPGPLGFCKHRAAAHVGDFLGLWDGILSWIAAPLSEGCSQVISAAMEASGTFSPQKRSLSPSKKRKANTRPSLDGTTHSAKASRQSKATPLSKSEP